jgi:uncharacterized protein YndB with AHSA1/START domain
MKTCQWAKAVAAVAVLSAGISQAQERPPVSTPGEMPPLLTEGVVAAPIDEAWKVFSTAEGYRKLGVAQAKLDFRPGGLLLSSYDPNATLGDEKTIETEIVAYEPRRLVVTRIVRPPKGFPFMQAYKHVWTVISLTDLGDNRTHVRIAMVGYGNDEESQKMRAFFAAGNSYVLKTLQSQFEPGKAPASAPHAESPLGVIDLTRVVHAERKSVWELFTTAAGWKRFFGVEAKIGRLPGEPFEIYFSPEGGARGAEGCRILSTVPGEMISFQWNVPADLPVARANPTWVVVTFESLASGVTSVRLRHFGFAEQAAAHPAEAKQFESARVHVASGWKLVMDRLANTYGSR